MGFYEQIAADYDTITASAAREVAAGTMVTELCERYGPLQAVTDIACGNGVYAMEFARLGANVTGVDLSTAMLAEAMRKSVAAGLRISWYEAPMQELAGGVPPAQDALVCMGNSLPHLLTDTELHAALTGFHRALKPGGILAIQLLNYTKLLAEHDRIVGVTRAADRQYVRFYDFLADRVRFNLLTLDWTNAAKCATSLATTMLRPYTQEPLVSALSEHGFERIESFTGPSFDAFNEAQSTVLLLVARAV